MAIFSAEAFREIVSGQRPGLLPGALRTLLATAEPVYAAIVARKNRRYDSGSLPITRVAVKVSEERAPRRIV